MNTLMQPILDQARVPASNAGWRTVIGEIAEQLAAEKLNARRMNTANGWYCPDIETPSFFGEVKAVGRSKCVIIYYVRLLKDREFVRHSRKPLCYVLVSHRAAIPMANAYDARFVVEATAVIHVVPFCYVDAICSRLTPRILNRNYKPSNGWCQRGYEKGGYCFPARKLIEACPHGRIL